MASPATDGSGSGKDSAAAFADAPDPSQSIELVQRIQGGDGDAMNELFERYRPRLRRIVSVQLGARLQRHLDEDDILQDVFLVAARKLAEFQPSSQRSLLQWFAKIALNEVRNRVAFHAAEKRADDQEVRLVRDSATQGAVRVAGGEPSPSQQALRAELEQLVDAAVQKLEPPEYREVILLRDYSAEEWESVRAQLERPTLAAVQELYRRAHQKLRERLRKHIQG